jgi:glycosyltransferase involved in cell wall biosynthesis
LPANLPKRTLLVVSDTALHKRGSSMYGFGPVVRELKELSTLFDEIVWLGCNEQEQLYADTLVNDPKIKCVLMPSVRNKQFNALHVLFAYPIFLINIFRYLLTATHVHSRGPSHPALISILYSFFDSKRIYWHKYAGDWATANAPFTYKLQRTLLKKLRRNNVRITINGDASSGAQNIISFENPALYEGELSCTAPGKNFNDKLSVLFVGNLTEAKGISNLLLAFTNSNISNRFLELIVVGDGELMPTIKLVSSGKVKLTGYLNREALQQYYQQCHLLVLPSRSEGFPKVVAEAAAYGCIPVVSDISNISQYIHHNENGFLMQDITVSGIVHTLNSIAAIDPDTLMGISERAKLLGSMFTYERFIERVKKEIFLPE